MSSALDTPMMKQFLSIKAQFPDAIVFYRMGDFYEMFLEDARLAAPLLDIALTTRDKGKPDAVPMCGVPVHAASEYLRQLAAHGHRVAICEQVESAKEAGGRRLVRREVVEVVTPGMVGDPTTIDGAREVALVAVCLSDPDQIGLAVLDASTGDFRATNLARAPAGDGAADWQVGGAPDPGVSQLLLDEIERIAPREIVIAESGSTALQAALRDRLRDVAFTVLSEQSFEPADAPVAPAGFDPTASDPAMRSAAAVIGYLGANQPFALSHPPRLRSYELRDTMVLDGATRAHLELFENSEDRGRRGTLFERIDLAATPLGSRCLARWLGYPLLDPERIRERQDAVAYLCDRDRARARARDALREVRDLERLLASALRPTSVPRDLGKLRASLEALPSVVSALEESADELLAEQADCPPGLVLPEPVPELAQLLRDALIDDPPVIARGSRGAGATGYVRRGFRADLDALRESATKGREWIAGLEAGERERTGIANLKVRFHPVHGYSLEVGKAQLSKVPEYFERKQTLASVERFTTPELRDREGSVRGASERAAELEREIFAGLREHVAAASERVRSVAAVTAKLDAQAALAEVARRDGWARPLVDSSERLEIRAGRHPVVEALLARRGGDGFVPNDCLLDTSDAQLLLLTGPNMSGKSTYLRQVALIVLLSQMGSWVPAEKATVGAVDRIFTRVGASDRLGRGESTFMVEMRETAEILAQASRRSLVILDEIGRGTSTYDGLAIAWAVAEYLHDTSSLGARTLFATHYHELTDLAATRPRVRNAHFGAREWKDEVVFLRQLVDGGASRSYGIQVARLAGVPQPVIDRARSVLKDLEAGAAAAARHRDAEGSGAQLSLALESEAGTERSADETEVLAEVREIDPDRLTPMDALAQLQGWRARLRRKDPS